MNPFKTIMPAQKVTRPIRVIKSMKFEFAKATEVTELVQKSDELKEKYKGYTRFFMVPDTLGVWLCRILPGFNNEYEKDDDIILVEREFFGIPNKDYIMTPYRAKKILMQDDCSSYDILQCGDVDECIKAIDGGFGFAYILDQKTELVQRY